MKQEKIMPFGVSVNTVIYFDKKKTNVDLLSQARLYKNTAVLDPTYFFKNVFLPSEHFIIGNEDSEINYIRYMAAFRP